MLSESLLLFAGAVLICVMILTAMTNEIKLERFIDVYETRMIDEKIKMHMNRQGYNTIEAIFSLYIVLFSINLIVTALPVFRYIIKDYEFAQDQLSIEQMRQILMLSEKIEVTENKLQFIYMNDLCQIQLHNERIVKNDGYQILMEGVESVTFYENDLCVYITYQKKDETKSHSRFLTCQQKRMD